jgi:hypothetical protein
MGGRVTALDIAVDVLSTVEPDSRFVIGEDYLILAGDQAGKVATCWYKQVEEGGSEHLLVDGARVPATLVNPPIQTGDSIVAQIDGRTVAARAVESVENGWRVNTSASEDVITLWVSKKSTMAGALAREKTRNIVTGLMTAGQRHGYTSSATDFVAEFPEVKAFAFTPTVRLRMHVNGGSMEGAGELRKGAEAAMTEPASLVGGRVMYPEFKVVVPVEIPMPAQVCRCRDMTLEDFEVESRAIRVSIAYPWSVGHVEFGLSTCLGCWFREYE